MTAAAATAGLASRLPGAPARWRAVGARLGRLTDDERTLASGAPAVWLHAASVGELNAARPLLRRLRERFAERLCVVSTLSLTGLELARSSPEAHLALLLPLDAPGTVRRLLAHFQLEAFFFTETEIWPTLLAELAARGVPTFMVSGRVGPGTMRHARWLRPLYRQALTCVDCCMQSEEDARRILALGADPRRVQVAGSLKFDAAAAEPPPDVLRLAAALGTRRMIVAGSTHAGEDEMVLEAFRRVLAGRADLTLLHDPRHPERLAAVADQVRAGGFSLARYSELATLEEGRVPAVILLDVVGPLAHCYALGVIAFVGGSLVPVGGHNVIEPARAGRPVLVGPHTEHAADTVERLVAGGAALRVGSAERLAWALAGLPDEPGAQADLGPPARGAGRGVVIVGEKGRPLVGPEEGGDEAVLLARRFAGPVVSGERRAEAAAVACARFALDALVLDDGFQHRALARDADLVLVSEETARAWPLPAGPLREPARGLARARALLTLEGVRDAPPGIPLFRGRLVATALVRVGADRSWREEPLAALRGARVTAVAGVARPERVLATLAEAGARVEHVLRFPDHHLYRAADARRIAAVGDGLVVTTEKDLVKP